MKKISILMIICLIFSGCAAYPKTEVSDDVMRLVISVDCDTAYGVTVEYSLGGERLGGMSLVRADGRRCRRGEQLVFSFLEENFPDANALSEETFGTFFRVIGKNEDELRPGFPEKWQNSSESYDGTNYSLSQGFFEDGTAAEPVWEWNAGRGGVYEFRLTESGSDGFYLFPIH